MQSILEELYLGNIDFDSGYYEPDSPLVQAAKKKRDSMKRLTATLDETEQELFEQYCDADGDMEGITRYNTYADALKFGILLMTEVFMDAGRNAGGRT